MANVACGEVGEVEEVMRWLGGWLNGHHDWGDDRRLGKGYESMGYGVLLQPLDKPISCTYHNNQENCGNAITSAQHITDINLFAIKKG